MAYEIVSRSCAEFPFVYKVVIIKKWSYLLVPFIITPIYPDPGYNRYDYNRNFFFYFLILFSSYILNLLFNEKYIIMRYIILTRRVWNYSSIRSFILSQESFVITYLL